MGYAIIVVTVFLSSLLTLFSGFGLGTILMPVYALFFPVDIAIAMTAVVHFLSNSFKLILMGKKADRKIVLRFGLPAIAASFAGAALLFALKNLPPVLEYEMGDRMYHVTPVKLVVALSMLVFAVMESSARFRDLKVDKKRLPLGGVLSGFFGGLSGHQGALRSAFLAKCGLTTEGFIATGVVIACMVDLPRIFVYGMHFDAFASRRFTHIMVISTLAEFAGVLIGRKFVHKVSMPAVKFLVVVMLITIALCLGAGLI